MNLNEIQQQAVTSDAKNILVIAGAGTGKTRVLTQRIIHLLNKGVKEQEIVAFTFTNKAAKEMEVRIAKLLNRPHRISISTFHSYCYRLLQRYHDEIGFDNYFTVIDEEDRLKLIKEIMSQHNWSILDKTVIKAISFYKNHVHHNLELYDQFIINYLSHQYQAQLHAMGKIDLDDLLHYTFRLLKDYPEIANENPLRHILVDECQDTNKIQMEIVYRLGQDANLFLVGDINQAIYSFRGSDIDNIENFIHYKSPQIFKLIENYRSSDNILRLANTLIDKNQQHLKNFLKSATKFDNDYQVICATMINEIVQAQYVSKLILLLLEKGYSQNCIAILYRNNSLSYALENELIGQKIPYHLFGAHPFYQRKEIKILISYYYFLFNQEDNISFSYIINTPARGIGEQTLQSIKAIAKTGAVSLFQAAALLSARTNNIALQKFIELIKTLKSDFIRLTPSEFLKSLIKRIDYTSYISSLSESKDKMDRLYKFHDIINSIKSDNHQQATIDFINQLSFQPDDEKDEQKVKLMTIHQSKGLEFPIVIVVGLNEGILPPSKVNPNQLEEERRLFYVATTRAQERLYLLNSHQYMINGKKTYLPASRFLAEIEDCFIITKG